MPTLSVQVERHCAAPHRSRIAAAFAAELESLRHDAPAAHEPPTFAYITRAIVTNAAARPYSGIMIKARRVAWVDRSSPAQRANARRRRDAVQRR
jgi:hypothetical protein